MQNFDLNVYRNWQYSVTSFGKNSSRYLESLSSNEEISKKGVGPRQQASMTNLCYSIQPYSDVFDQYETVVTVVDKYGSLLVNLKTHDVY